MNAFTLPNGITPANQSSSELLRFMASMGSTAKVASAQAERAPAAIKIFLCA